jgi:hypothetical protein
MIETHGLVDLRKPVNLEHPDLQHLVLFSEVLNTRGWFGNTSRNLVSLSGRGRVSALHDGTVRSTGSPSIVQGTAFRAQGFHGGLARYHVNTEIKYPSTNANLTAGTIACSIKVDSTVGASYRGIIVKQLQYGIFCNGGVLVSYDWVNGAERNTGVDLRDGKWHHLIYSFATGTNSTAIYVDGRRRLTTTYSVGAGSSVGLVVGTGADENDSVSGAAQAITGAIGDVMLFDKQIGYELAGALINDGAAYRIYQEWKTGYPNYLNRIPFRSWFVPTSTSHSVAPNDCSHVHTASSPTITQTHVLIPDNGNHGHSVTSPSISQIHAVAPADGLHGHTATSPTIDVLVTVSPNDASHGHASTSPTITQTHEISPSAGIHSHSASSPSLEQIHAINPASGSHSHSATSPSISQVHVITPGDAYHSHSATSPTISGAGTIIADDGLHPHEATSPTLSQIHEVSPNAANHSLSSNEPSISQLHLIFPSGSIHQHSASSPSIGEEISFTPNSTLHLLSSTSPDIGLNLVPNNGQHAHTSTSPSISQIHSVSPADAYHLHQATSPDVNQFGEVISGWLRITMEMFKPGGSFSYFKPTATLEFQE